MLIALIATTLASDDMDLDAPSTLSPYAGEGGRWTPVRFEAEPSTADDRLCPCGCGGPAPR